MKKNVKYWTVENQDAIVRYYQAQTKEEKDLIFTKELYQPLLGLVRQALHTHTGCVDADKLQELMIRISTYTLPNIKGDKIQAAHNLIWLSVKRHIFSMWQSEIIKPEYYSTTTDSISDWESTSTCVNQFEVDDEVQQQRKLILLELDKKIEQQQILNKKATIFIILLKEYIIENNYDVRGFRRWCCVNMGLTKSRFSNICSTVKIINSDFNKDRICESKQVQERARKYMKKK